MSNQPSDPAQVSTSHAPENAEPETVESETVQHAESTSSPQEATDGNSSRPDSGAGDASSATSPAAAEETKSDTTDAVANAAATSGAEQGGTEQGGTEQGEVSDADAAASASPTSPRKPISIGSQRDTADKALAPTLPKAVREAASKPVAVPRSEAESDGPQDVAPERATQLERKPPKEHVPVPSKRQTSDEIESELQAALGSVSMDEVLAKNDSAVTEEIEIEGRYKGTVTRIHNDDVFFSLKGRFEGVASARQFKKPPEVGAMTDVVVKAFNEEDGIYELAIPGASISVEDWSDLEVGSVVEARVTGSNTGGLECMVNNIRGFIPASQIAIHRVENLGDYVNKKLTCMVTEAKPKRKNLVLSHRRVLEKELEAVRKESMSRLEVGAVVEGKVTRLREFGAFVDIGGIEGLVHISKLSWDRIDKPEDVLNEGDQIKVKIEKISPESGKISLSYRDTIEHPWEGIEDRFPVDSVAKGTVTRLANFGAFVKLAPGVEGLVHISELAHHRVVAVKNIVKEGDEVEVKVLSVDRDGQKIGLSMKATQPVPEKTKEEAPAVEEEPHRELAVRKRRKSLKGGMDRRSGGDSFGLKW